MDERIEVVRHTYQGLNRGEIDFDLIHPDVRVVQTTGLVGTAGEFEGHEGLRRCMEELFEGFEMLRFDPQEYEDLSDDRLLVPCRVTGRGAVSGAELDAPVWHIWGFREGLISLLEVHIRRRHALEAASG